MRFLNVILGAWVAISPFVFEGTTTAIVANTIAGVLLMGLSLPRGTRSDEHYGGWDRLIV